MMVGNKIRETRIIFLKKMGRQRFPFMKIGHSGLNQ